MTKALLNNDPEVGHVVVWIRGTGDRRDGVELAFESAEDYYSRNLMARPRMLVSWALKLWWKGFLHRMKHGKQPKPSFATVKEELHRG
jgi:hypothetical protein